MKNLETPGERELRLAMTDGLDRIEAALAPFDCEEDEREYREAIGCPMPVRRTKTMLDGEYND
jgi:hypothetical protein